MQEKIGDNEKVNSVFVGRQTTGELYSSSLKGQQPDRDWILSRILWLSGLEPDKNQAGSVDTLQRYIYIHGCPDEEPVGIPLSHGCIRMRNDDVIALYAQVTAGTHVFIDENSLSEVTPILPFS